MKLTIEGRRTIVRRVRCQGWTVARAAEAMDVLRATAPTWLDRELPASIGALFQTLEQHELSGRFEEVLPADERLWWDETSPEWIAAVTGRGRPVSTGLVPGGLSPVPGLPERLSAGCRPATAPLKGCGPPSSPAGGS